MANYNIYGHVLYSEIQYEDLMHQTEKIFIRSLMAKVPDITDWTNTIWNDIDHEYMIRTLEEIKRDIIDNDLTSLLKYDNTAIDINEVIEASKNLANMYDINNISKFKAVEKAYGKKIAKAYKRRIEMIDTVDELEYLTQQIKNFSKLEQTIPYYSGGEIIRTVTPSTYLSMLYNVNITRTGWNQTFKDAEYFNKDLMILETHPNSCEHCKPYQR